MTTAVLCRHCAAPLTRRGPAWHTGDGVTGHPDLPGVPHEPMPEGLHGAADPADLLQYLTIWQPWAWLIAAGYKTVENRGRLYTPRGLVAIHAGLHIDRPALESRLVRAAIDNWLGNGYLTGVPPWEIGGRVLAVADGMHGHLASCAPALGCDAGRRCSPWAVDDPGGTFHHMLDGVIQIDPVPARGAQQLWTPKDPGITREVLARRAAANPT